MAEHVLRGVSAAPGMIAGRAVVLKASVATPVTEVRDRSAEFGRARLALSAEITSLETIVERLRQEGAAADADIVDAGVLMAKDPGLSAAIEKLVLEEGRGAAAAIVEATEDVAGVLAALEDPTLAERAADVRSIGRRAAAHASGTELVPGGVLIAEDLGPADIADLAQAGGGAALSRGGVTAHAAIVARSLGIPMVVGLGDEALEVQGGETVVLDADGGVLVRRPGASRVEAATVERARAREARETARGRRDIPATTVDGCRITVLVNAATAAEADEGLQQGAEGIGLLRTELAFLDAPAWPSAERQAAVLRPVFARLAGRPVTVRLFDFGADKTPPYLRGTDKRGIELLLESPEVLRSQLAAIVSAAGDAGVRILVPMVTDGRQLRDIRAALSRVTGDAAQRPQLGAMIETPAAAQAADAIAAEADFFSIGTNDLTQLVLGLDRERSTTAPVLDPRVLRLIDATVRAAHQARILVDVCGEAASDPTAMPVLVGLGVDELSVAAARVGKVRQWIRELDFGRCRRQALGLLDQAGDASRKRV